MTKIKLFVLSEPVLLILVLQALRILSEKLICSLIPVSGDFYPRMITMVVMALMSGAVILYARLMRTRLCVFPQRFGKLYIISTVVAAVVLITVPSNYTGGYKAVLLLVYGSVVTPIFEELIFRGYMWNRLNAVVSKEIFTYIYSIALFAFWHLFYMMSQLAQGNIIAVLIKLAAGVCYGAVLGFVRLRCGNCYITMLLHGVINVFMV